MPSTSPDEQYMRRALALAAKAAGDTSPNPLVGAVLVKRGRIVGEGFHRRAGLPHAEVVALRGAGAKAKGATLYVTLEPCNHTGRTPPCCEALIRAGIGRVVAAGEDPNPRTRGRGFARLRRTGMPVEHGLLRREAEALNAPFFSVMRRGVPLVIAKAGQSLDGKIATARGESRWITSAASRAAAHRLRRQVDAILVGVNTVLRDDPRLNVRGIKARPGRPVKVIVDSHLRTPPRARCLSSASLTLIATTTRASARVRALQRRGAEVIHFAARRGRVPLRPLCRALAKRGLQSVLIEGGGETLAGAFEERLVDRVVLFIAPLVIGGRQAVSSVGGAGAQRLARAAQVKEMTVRPMGPDVCVEGRVVYPGR